jgi:hypothetical protein
MELNRISVPDDVIRSLAMHYKDVVTKAGQAAVVYGRQSNEYALALALLTATVTAVEKAYGFNTEGHTPGDQGGHLQRRGFMDDSQVCDAVWALFWVFLIGTMLLLLAD